MQIRSATQNTLLQEKVGWRGRGPTAGGVGARLLAGSGPDSTRSFLCDRALKCNLHRWAAKDIKKQDTFQSCSLVSCSRAVLVSCLFCKWDVFAGLLVCCVAAALFLRGLIFYRAVTGLLGRAASF